MAGTVFLLLDAADNILVCTQSVPAGTPTEIDGSALILPQAVELGHKIARADLAAGERVLRYGIPIGTMTEAASRGSHVHSHNLKSDYIPAHHRDATGNKNSPS